MASTRPSALVDKHADETVGHGLQVTGRLVLGKGSWLLVKGSTRLPLWAVRTEERG